MIYILGVRTFGS